MSKSYRKISRQNMRKLTTGEKITENGITFERLIDGDGRFSVNIMVDGQRIHRVIGKESEKTTRTQVEEYISKVRNDAKHDRLGLPKGRKTSLTLREAAERYLGKLEEEDGRDLKKKRHRLESHLIPIFGKSVFSKVSTFDVERYKKSRRSAGAAFGTINRELAVPLSFVQQGY